MTEPTKLEAIIQLNETIAAFDGRVIVAGTALNYNSSWDAIMPVAKKLVTKMQEVKKTLKEPAQLQAHAQIMSGLGNALISFSLEEVFAMTAMGCAFVKDVDKPTIIT